MHLKLQRYFMWWWRVIRGTVFTVPPQACCALLEEYESLRGALVTVFWYVERMTILRLSFQC